MTGFRFPSLGLTFCPECGVELDPDIETYRISNGTKVVLPEDGTFGTIEYTHGFHGTCSNSDKKFLGKVRFVECTEINMKVN